MEKWTASHGKEVIFPILEEKTDFYVFHIFFHKSFPVEKWKILSLFRIFWRLFHNLNWGVFHFLIFSNYKTFLHFLEGEFKEISMGISQVFNRCWKLCGKLVFTCGILKNMRVLHMFFRHVCTVQRSAIEPPSEREVERGAWRKESAALKISTRSITIAQFIVARAPPRSASGSSLLPEEG